MTEKEDEGNSSSDTCQKENKIIVRFQTSGHILGDHVETYFLAARGCACKFNFPKCETKIKKIMKK